MKPSKHEHEAVLNTLHTHYASTHLTAERLAEYIGISVRHLNNICKAYYGKTPAKLIQCYRIQKALEFFSANGEKEFNCSMVGYVNHRTFTTALKEYHRQHTK